MANIRTSNGKTHANGTPKAKKAEEGRIGAYFLSLSLENVRCFGPKQTLDLSDGNGKPARWTILLGLNGMGKTTILQSLAGKRESRKRIEDTSGELFLFRPRMFAEAKEARTSFNRNLDHRPFEWTVRTIVTNSIGKASPLVIDYPFQIGKLGALMMDPKVVSSGSPVGLEISVPWCCGYGAARRMGSAIFGDDGADDGMATLFSDKADLLNPEEWLLRLDYAASKPSHIKVKRKERFDQVTKLILSVLPDEDNIDEIRIVTSEATNPTSRVEFKTPYGWVPMRQLGFGYQTLITWVADFANRMVERYPDSKNPLHEPAVCLVDEIDLHLHPIWQRKLIGFLSERFPNTQFIATAHSPLVAQAAADANLAVLRREGDHVVIDNDVDNIRNWRVDQILTSELFGLKTAWPPWMEEDLEARKAILTKSKLTKEDQKQLKQIESRIGDLPAGQTAQEVREMDQIRRTLDLLTKEHRPSQMIRIPKPTMAPAVLLDQGVRATELLCRAFDAGEKLPKFSPAIYADESVKDALWQAQHGKCAFCESPIRHTNFGDVEHYRPKGGYKQRMSDKLTKPGYFWLVYAWDNLFIACPLCNQRFKRNLFPLKDKRKRAKPKSRKIDREQPLLIHPTEQDPTDFIGFREEYAHAIGECAEGFSTIEIVGLNREAMTTLRRKRLEILRALLNCRTVLQKKQAESFDREIGDQLNTLDEILSNATRPDSEYSSMSRAFLSKAGIS